MNEQTQTPKTNPLDGLEMWLKELIRKEVIDAMAQANGNGNGHQGGDRLLDAEEACMVLSVSKDWLYAHAKKLPFTRKLGPKMIRFSSKGIQKYLETRKVS